MVILCGQILALFMLMENNNLKDSVNFLDFLSIKKSFEEIKMYITAGATRLYCNLVKHII